jgi:hypothetical protein
MSLVQSVHPGVNAARWEKAPAAYVPIQHREGRGDYRHETASTALTFTMQLLGLHPDVQAAVNRSL